MGAQKVKGKFAAPLLSQGTSDLRYADVLLSNSDIKALRATPKTLVPAPGTGKILEFLSAVVMLKVGTNVLAEDNDPKSGYARTWASQSFAVTAGIAGGATVIAAKDNAESPLRIYGPGSNLADHRLLEVTAGGELILAGDARRGQLVLSA
jgi:hypothetical protein